jgi:hypothetical protein
MSVGQKIEKIGEGLARLNNGKVIAYCCCNWDDSSEDDSLEPTEQERHPLCPHHSEAGKAAYEKAKGLTRMQAGI